jgi:hypothetical protein
MQMYAYICTSRNKGVRSCTFQLCTNNSKTDYVEQNATKCKRFGKNAYIEDQIGPLQSNQNTRINYYEGNFIATDYYQYEHDHSYIFGVASHSEVYNCASGFVPVYINPKWDVDYQLQVASQPCSLYVAPTTSSVAPTTSTNGSTGTGQIGSSATFVPHASTNSTSPACSVCTSNASKAHASHTLFFYAAFTIAITLAHALALDL